MVHKGHFETIDPIRAAVYVPVVLEHMPRLLGCVDREPNSLSYGNFDRTHWGWKFCDFPVGMAQISAYPMGILWRYPFAGNPYYRNPQVLTWLHGVMEYICRQQRRNGALDSVGPFTQDHGNSLFMGYLLAELRRLLGTALDPSLDDAITRAVAAAASFALHSGEDYAFISNHQATYALAFHNAAELTGDERFARRAQENIAAIIAKQSFEGWYEEYGGPDPGYESLGIFYLASYWQRTGDPQVLDSLRRSVKFASHFVHPDGGIGGVYGNRNTSLYMPGGFEMLAPEVPEAAAIAGFMRERLSQGNVVTPATCDSQNLGVLMYTYLEGCFAPPVKDAPPALPCEVLRGIRRFPLAGSTVAGTPSYYAIANTSKGGVCRAFDRSLKRVAYEDAGYVAVAGSKRYSSQLAGMSHEVPHDEADELVSDGVFGEVCQVLPTAEKWIVLRLLNLTLFRSLTLGAWVRRKILAKLILGRRQGPLRLIRSIRFGETEIVFRDRVMRTGSIQVKTIELARSFTPIHMGSAKYFHPSELEDVALPPLGEAVSRLNSDAIVDREFVVRFSAAQADSGVRLEVSTRA